MFEPNETTLHISFHQSHTLKKLLELMHNQMFEVNSGELTKENGWVKWSLDSGVEIWLVKE